ATAPIARASLPCISDLLVRPRRTLTERSVSLPGPASGALPSARLRVRRRDAALEQVEPVGDLEQARRLARMPRLPVLPDDPLGGRVDQHDAVAVVVVRPDQAVRQPLREARVVEHAVSVPRVVGPEDLARAIE